MFCRFNLQVRIGIGLTVLVLFLCYFWINICHNLNSSSATFMCPSQSTNGGRSLKSAGLLWNLVHQQQNTNNHSERQPIERTPVTLQEAIYLYTDAKRDIILSVMDMGCLDMAVNLYLSSFKKLGFTNYVFLSSDSEACPKMLTVSPDVHCIHYADDQDAVKASSYGTKSFIRKTYIKSKAVQEALLLGYNVLLMDIDIVIFKNPFPYFEECSDCDLQIQWDHGTICSGFYYIRSTKGGNLFIQKVWDIAKKGSMKGREKISFQKAANGLKGYKGFKQKVLPEKQFPNGHAHFHGHKIMFATDGDFPPTSYIVHDNWIISQSAKIYRFKENLMWYYDKDGYYSNPKAKYIMYSVQTADIDTEIKALKAALLLGHILKRIVIFPSFSCSPCNTKKFPVCKVKSKKCSFITKYKMEAFDKSFASLYREHMFLQNDMVPLTVKQSRSKVIVPDTHKGAQSASQIVLPLSSTQTLGDLHKWSSAHKNTSVLVLDHLQTAWTDLSERFQDNDITHRLNSAIKHTNYLQE